MAERIFFYTDDSERLAQIALRGWRCPILGIIPGQAVWGSEQPALVADVPADCRGVGLDEL